MDSGHMWTVIIVALVAINAFLVYKLLGKKVTKPNKSAQSNNLDRDDRGTNTPRNLGFIFIAFGAVLLGFAVLWEINDPESWLPMLFLGLPGGLFFIIGLILLIGFYIQKLLAKRKESPKYKD